jgi:hypothetical protein
MIYYSSPTSQYDNTGTGAFEYLTVLAIAKAVNAYRERHNVSEDYKVSITIDGLKGSEGLRVGRELRELGIKSRKVRGARDESEPFIRLADRLAGLVRDAETGEQQGYKTRRRQLEKQRIITELEKEKPPYLSAEGGTPSPFGRHALDAVFGWNLLQLQYTSVTAR